jgi:hypothetical protein
MRDTPIYITDDERDELIKTTGRFHVARVYVEGAGIPPTKEELAEFLDAYAEHQALFNRLIAKYSG